MRLAITGAGGFVGGAAVRHFAARGDTIHAFGRRPAAAFAGPPGVEYHRWDLAAGPYPAPPAVDAVVHCAAAVAPWGPYAPFHRVNVDGTRHLLVTFGPAARLVHLSSASVYDPLGGAAPLEEGAPYPARYLNAYGRTKMLAERLLLASDRPVVILRPRAIYGPGDTTLLPRLLRAARRPWLPVPGSGAQRMSITAIDNLLGAIERAVEVRGATGPFNVADALAPRLDELLLALLGTCGRAPRLVRMPPGLAWAAATAAERAHAIARRPGEPPLTRYAVAQLARSHLLDLGRARDLLGYRPVVDYRDLLPAIAAAAAPSGAATRAA